MSVFLLIGKTSALTMNVAGVLKDWLLIGVSVLLYKWVAPAAAWCHCMMCCDVILLCSRLPACMQHQHVGAASA
jgi:hypothetical protein